MKKSFGAKTLIYPTPVWCVGTYGNDNQPNVATIAWGGISCSEPPCINISLREATYTHGNILNHKAFTINVPSAKQVKEADYFGIVSGRDVNKFERAGVTPIRSDLIDAPYIEEFPVIVECELFQHHKLGLHTLFVGKVIDVKVSETCLDEEGSPDIEKIAPFSFAPFAKGYRATGGQIGNPFQAGKAFKTD